MEQVSKRQLRRSWRLPVALALLFVVACGNTGGTSAPKPPIKIGALWSLTGYLASYDKPEADGAQLAVDNINAHGGVSGSMLQLIAMDIQSAPATAATYATKLIVENQVTMLVTGASSGGTAAIAPIAAQHSVPVIAGSVLSVPPPDWVYTSTPNPLADVTVRAAYAQSLHFNRVGVINDPTPYARLQLKTIQDKAASYGLTILGPESYANDATDLTAVLSKLVGKADVIFKLGGGTSDILAAKNMAALGTSVPLWLSGGDLATDKQASQAYSNTAFMAHPDQVPDQITDPATKAALRTFLDLWTKKYPNVDASNGANGWDTVNIAIAAMQKANSTDGTKILSALQSLTYQGTNVRYEFSKTVHSDTSNSYRIAAVKNGKVVIIYDPSKSS